MKIPFMPGRRVAKISAAILQKPRRNGGRIEKGVLLLNTCDRACALIPGLKRYFYLVERRGWAGMNAQETGDVKLVDDLRTLAETRRRFPRAIVLEFANADFVDTDAFRPLGSEKRYAGIQIAAWRRFKRHGLFVKAAALLPDRKFLKFGHFWNEGGREGIKERRLESRTISQARRRGAQVDFLESSPDDSANGMLGSAEEVNRAINSARMGILTSTTEGVNRFKMECLSADIPFLVAEDASFPTKKHINTQTGVFFKPTPQGLADAVRYVEDNYGSFSPRDYILKNTGIRVALPKLKEALCELARRDGSLQTFDGITWNGRNERMVWGGDHALEGIRRAIVEIEAEVEARRP